MLDLDILPETEQTGRRTDDIMIKIADNTV